MNAFVIIMFTLMMILFGIIIALVLKTNKRLDTVDSRLELQNDRNKKLQEYLSEAVCHINSIYKELGNINGYLPNMNNTVNEIHLKCGNITNDITKYVHTDNDNRNKEIINCLANTSNDLRTLISDVNKRVLDFKAMYITDIDNRTHDTKAIIDDIKTIKLLSSTINNSIDYINDILKNRVIGDNEQFFKFIDWLKPVVDNIYHTVHGNTVDIKEATRLISNLDPTKISSALEKLQNAVNYTDEQKETPKELKTVTKSKSAKSGKSASKKKTPLL